jgi:hypothetical protein
LFSFADLEMSFNPAALLSNVHKKAKGPKPKVLAPSKGKKRARDAPSSGVVTGPGQSSRSPGLHPQPSPRPSASRGTPEVVNLEEDAPLPRGSIEDHARCPLIPDLVAKYRDEIDPEEGVRALELASLKVRNLDLGPISISSCWVLTPPRFFCGWA